MNNKKMQNWKLVGDDLVFSNYLEAISSLDHERVTIANRHHISILGVVEVINSCYQEIKSYYKERDSLRYLAGKMMGPKSTIQCWLCGSNPIPIYAVDRLLTIWKKDCGKSQREYFDKKQEIFERIRNYSIAGGSGNTILPKKLSTELAYLMGFILADGYIKNDLKLIKRKANPEYSIAMYSNSQEFLEDLREGFNKLFGVNCNLHYSEDKKGSWHTLRCTSKPVHRFFCDVLGFTRGSKTGRIVVPHIIAQAPEKFQKAFISGFFDGDGGVGISSKNPWLELVQVSYSSGPIPIILWIQEKLNDFGVEMTLSQASQKNLWRLRTGSKGKILKFYDLISSRNPEKINKYELIKEFSYGTQV